MESRVANEKFPGTHRRDFHQISCAPPVVVPADNDSSVLVPNSLRARISNIIADHRRALAVEHRGAPSGGVSPNLHVIKSETRLFCDTQFVLHAKNGNEQKASRKQSPLVTTAAGNQGPTQQSPIGLLDVREIIRKESSSPMHSVMENDSSQLQQDCPKAKKSKTDNDFAYASSGCWECLPAVILDDIFQYLSFKDSINASSTCHNWRQSLYHPRKWQSVHFVIEPKTLAEAQFYRLRAGSIVSNASVHFNSIEPSCVAEFLLLLRCFTCNNNLKSLSIEPTHSTIELPENMMQNTDESPLYKLFAELYAQHSLTTLSLGCNEELFEYVPELLAIVEGKKSEKIETLALATVKEDPCNYVMLTIEPKQLMAFRRVQIFSVDYDNMNDDVLNALCHLDDLRRVVVHVHGILKSHPGTSDGAWLKLRAHQPNCLLRLSCIHSTDEVNHLHSKVLKDSMPLSHLKVLFCEQMNLNVLVKLTMYRNTFVSLVWVDNFANVDHNLFLRDEMDVEMNEDIQPQELIILAWLCKKLAEIIVFGYKLPVEDWVGIARLRAESLQCLEIAESDLVGSNEYNIVRQVSYVLGKCWRPLPDSALHPSIVDPSVPDTDEYLLPMLLTDLK